MQKMRFKILFFLLFFFFETREPLHLRAVTEDERWVTRTANTRQFSPLCTLRDDAKTSGSQGWISSARDKRLFKAHLR